MDDVVQGQPTRQVQQVAAVFDLVADTYENVGVPWFTPIAEALVEVVGPAPGERVLDIGCGRGAALFPLARAVGPSGRVLGIDIAPRMVDRTRAEVRGRGLEHVAVEVMDASTPVLDAGSFDVAVASLVLFFLPNPGQSLASWRRSLVPGGRLGVTTFADRDAGWVELDEVFAPHLPAQMLDARTSGAKGPFSSDAGVTGLVEAAGYGDVRHATIGVEVSFDTPAQWEAWSRSHGQRAMWEAVPEDHRDTVRSAAAEVLERSRGDDGVIRLGQRVRITTATNPG